MSVYVGVFWFLVLLLVEDFLFLFLLKQNNFGDGIVKK